MFGCYTGDVSISDGAKSMDYYEKIADEFAFRKLREVKTLFKDKLVIREPNYKISSRIPISHYEMLITTFIEKINEEGYTNKEEISGILYNYVKNGK